MSAMDLSLLWNSLPLRFKVAYGRDDGDTPSCEVLASYSKTKTTSALC